MILLWYFYMLRYFQAKYSYFVGGQEVAYIMFDTRGDMHKDTFFDNSKIVLSSYSDIKSYGKEFMKIDG